MGTLGGIGELAKEVLGEGSKAAPVSKGKRETSAGRGTTPQIVPGVPRIEG